MITNISFASIPVTDLDRAKVFWSETVGFDVTVDVEAIPGMRWIMLRVGDSATQLQFNDVSEMPETSMPAMPFASTDVAGTIEMLRGKGVEIIKDPGPAEWDANMTYALFKDSEGNVILVGSQ